MASDVDLGICEPEINQFGRHFFCDFCPRNIWSHVGFYLPPELLRPEIEFPLPISFSRSVSQTRDKSSIATWTDIVLFVPVVACKRGLEACSVAGVGSWDHTLGLRLSQNLESSVEIWVSKVIKRVKGVHWATELVTCAANEDQVQPAAVAKAVKVVKRLKTGEDSEVAWLKRLVDEHPALQGIPEEVKRSLVEKHAPNILPLGNRRRRKFWRTKGMMIHAFSGKNEGYTLGRAFHEVGGDRRLMHEFDITHGTPEADLSRPGRNQFGTKWNQFVHGRVWRWIFICFCGF